MICSLKTGRLRYCIYKDINDSERFERTKEFLSHRHGGPSLFATYFGAIGPTEREEVFSFLHRLTEHQKNEPEEA